MTDRFTVDIVSPQFPCGAAWLANALIELDVRPEHLWGFETAHEWREEPDGTSVYSAAELPWRQTLASLRIGRAFRFRTDVRPRFSHAFPWQHDLAPAIVLMVRDPRDALYSEWQRHRRNLGLPQSTTFPQFVAQPFFDGPISNIDMLWLHLRAWIRFADIHDERIRVMRFEDWKRAPDDSLRSVAQWMDIEPDNAAIARAADSSDVRHLQAAEAALHAADSAASRQFNRRGAADEWRETWEAEWFDLFGPQWQPVFDRLGYLTERAWGPAAMRYDDLSNVLAWRGLEDPQSIERWRDLIAGDQPLRTHA